MCAGPPVNKAKVYYNQLESSQEEPPLSLSSGSGVAYKPLSGNVAGENSVDPSPPGKRSSHESLHSEKSVDKSPPGEKSGDESAPPKNRTSL
jgi:hypothetical protein